MFEGTGGKYRFFIQAEDGIRVVAVTGVQTCALPISITNSIMRKPRLESFVYGHVISHTFIGE